MKTCFLLLPFVLLGLVACKKDPSQDDYVYIPPFYCELDGVPVFGADTVIISDSVKINFSSPRGNFKLHFPISTVPGTYSLTSEGPFSLVFDDEISQQSYTMHDGALIILFNGMEGEVKKVEGLFHGILMTEAPVNTVVLNNGKFSQLY